MNEFGGVFAISCVAVLAPLLIRLPAFALMPVVGLELVLGVLIGPSVMGLVKSDNTIKFLAEFGLVFLFFQAGSSRNETRSGGPNCALAHWPGSPASLSPSASSACSTYSAWSARRCSSPSFCRRRRSAF